MFFKLILSDNCFMNYHKVKKRALNQDQKTWFITLTPTKRQIQMFSIVSHKTPSELLKEKRELICCSNWEVQRVDVISDGAERFKQQGPFLSLHLLAMSATVWALFLISSFYLTVKMVPLILLYATFSLTLKITKEKELSFSLSI